MITSCELNAPYINKLLIKGTASTANAAAAGSANIKVKRKPQSNNCEYSLSLLSATLLERLGNSIVPKVTPSKPVGNSIRRSAKYSHDTLPLIKKEAIIVLINIDI